MNKDEKQDILLNGHRVDSHGIAKQIERGAPPEVFEEGQKCKICGAILRMYNPYDVCTLHIDKTAQDIQDQRIIPKKTSQLDSLTDQAIKHLRVKARKPLPRSRVRACREFQ